MSIWGNVILPQKDGFIYGANEPGVTCLWFNTAGAEIPADPDVSHGMLLYRDSDGVLHPLYPMTTIAAVYGLDNRVDTAVRKAAPRNLLDNSDFRNPVNQRGQTSYTLNAWGGYCIDRWRAGGQALTLTINDNGCTLSGEIYQTIDPKGNAKNLNGKTVTIAAKVNGSICCRSGHIELIGGLVQFADFSIPGGRGYIYADSNNNLHMGLETDGTVTVEWVALYEGEYTAETLPEYHPKGYGAELAECQRYYLKGKLVCRKAQWQFYNCWCNFPVTMRINNPTVTLSDPKDFATGTNTGVSATPNNVDANGLYAISLSGTIDSDVIIIDNYVASADL